MSRRVFRFTRFGRHTERIGTFNCWALRVLRRVDRDQRGTISIVTVFALLMFTMLLVMIVNIGRHVDDKIKMQNAADAAAYSGGVVLARGMNAVAFTNHLLCDVFAITAYLREGRDRNAEQLVPQILQAWTEVGQRFSGASFQKFSLLGPAVVDKVPKEQQAVTTFGEMTAAASAFALPVFEQILGEPAETPLNPDDPQLGGSDAGGSPDSGSQDQYLAGQTHLIPVFQRTLIRTIPELAQQATAEIARRHGLFRGQTSESQNDPGSRRAARRGEQAGVLWRTSVETVGYSNEDDPLNRTLPIVDPDPNDGDVSVPFAGEYLNDAQRQRRNHAQYYLDRWNNIKLSFMRDEAKMSQLFNLWVIATCAQLNRLLDDEYPESNLPMLVRKTEDGHEVEGIFRRLERGDPRVNVNRQVRSRRNELQFPGLMEELRSELGVDEYIERDFNFVAVVSRRHLSEMGPGIFRNPLNVEADAATFAQVSLFIPRPRRYLRYVGQSAPGDSGRDEVSLGGTFGFDSELAAPPRPGQGAAGPGPRNPEDESWPLENWPTHWDLWNQNWSVNLVPATASTISEILQTQPYGTSARVLELGGATNRELKQINTH